MPDQPDLLFLLHDIARQLRVSGDRRARAHGMTRAQWVLLWRVQQQPGLSQKELAEIMEVEPITVARLVDRLAARGMVERRGDPGDRRIWRLHLLPPAVPVLEHMQGERVEVARILTAGLAPDMLEAVRRSLITMKANIVCDLRNRAADPAPLPAPPRRPANRAAPATSASPQTAFQQDRP